MNVVHTCRRRVAFLVLTCAAAGAPAAGELLSFTKIANGGTQLPAGATLGPGPNDWACTRDDKTGLTWEVKTDDGGLRDSKFTYTPYESHPATPGGFIGYRDTTSGQCVRSLMAGGSCNTEAYVEAVNKARLCGFSDWRLPAVQEMVRIAGERTPEATAVTARAFPNTAPGWYWTGVAREGPSSYSRVILLPPGARAHFYDGSYLVRVVRGGQ